MEPLGPLSGAAGGMADAVSGIIEQRLRQAQVANQVQQAQAQLEETKRYHDLINQDRLSTEGRALNESMMPGTDFSPSDPMAKYLSSVPKMVQAPAPPESLAADPTQQGPVNLPGTIANAPSPDLGRLLTKTPTFKQEDTSEKLQLQQQLADAKATNPKLFPVDTIDENGRSVRKYLTADEVQGQTFRKPPNATTANRLDSAEAVSQTGNDIITQLSDPAVKAQLGPVMGRYNSLREFFGNPPPELAHLAGEIESYAFANMGIHGMRSVQGSNQINAMLDRRHTPESMIEFVKGLQKFSTNLLEGQGRKVPGATATPAAAAAGAAPAAAGATGPKHVKYTLDAQGNIVNPTEGSSVAPPPAAAAAAPPIPSTPPRAAAAPAVPPPVSAPPPPAPPAPPPAPEPPLQLPVPPSAPPPQLPAALPAVQPSLGVLRTMRPPIAGTGIEPPPAAPSPEPPVQLPPFPAAPPRSLPAPLPAIQPPSAATVRPQVTGEGIEEPAQLPPFPPSPRPALPAPLPAIQPPSRPQVVGEGIAPAATTASSRMQMSSPGLAALKQREGGFKGNSGFDVNGPAVGYGMHQWQGKPTTTGMRVTQPEADAEMLRQLEAHYARDVNRVLKVPLQQHEFDALVSVAWNLPSAAKELAQKLNRGETLTLDDFLKSGTQEGQRTKGLQNRRRSEYQQYRGGGQQVLAGGHGG